VLTEVAMDFGLLQPSALTPDMGGKATTAALGRAIAAEI